MEGVVCMKGYKEPTESFMLSNIKGEPLTVRALATICKALDDNVVEQDWLVSFCENGIRFDLCDFNYENEVKK